MGTNYYMLTDVCPHCGRPAERKHIGKSSAGWAFGLRIYPDEGINTLEDWKRVWAGQVIEDEYERRLSVDELLNIITVRGDPGKLLRRERQGEGTWDYVPYEFS